MHLLINIFYEHIKRLWMKEASLEIGTSKIHGYAKNFVESSQESYHIPRSTQQTTYCIYTVEDHAKIECPVEQGACGRPNV